MKGIDFIAPEVYLAEIEAAAAAQSEAEIKNAIKRHQARMAEYRAWVDPKAIAARILRHEEEAAAALAAAGPPQKSLPIPDPLPDEMVGQSPSTIQAMLRHRCSPENE